MWISILVRPGCDFWPFGIAGFRLTLYVGEEPTLGVDMCVRADERVIVRRGQAGQPDRVRWVLAILRTGPRFRFREDEDLFLGK